MGCLGWIKSIFLFIAMLALFAFPLVLLAAIFYPPFWGLVIILGIILLFGLQKGD